MRVSTDNDRQVLDLQRDALLSAGLMSASCSMITSAAAKAIAPVSQKL